MELDDLWSLLTQEQRHRALVTLSGIVLRQLAVLPEEGEVCDEPS